MASDKNQKIVLTIIVLAVAVLLGNLLGLFTIFQASPIGSTAFSNYWGTVTSRSSGSFSFDATSLKIGRDEDDYRYRAFIDFDISQVPDTAIIHSVKLYIYPNAPSYGLESNEYIRAMSTKGYDIVGGDKQTLFNTLGSGAPYISLTGAARMFSSTGYKTIDLGDDAINDLTDNLPLNYFSIALDSSLSGGSPAGEYFSLPNSGNPPRLLIDYTLPCVPDNSCVANTCTTGTCTNNCGTVIQGTKNCTIPSSVACTSFTYSNFGACLSNNMQYRAVATSLPAGCSGGFPVLAQACTYVPITNCTPNWQTSSWSVCSSSGIRTRTVTDTNNCGTTNQPISSQACTYTNTSSGTTNTTSTGTTSGTTSNAFDFQEFWNKYYIAIIIGAGVLLLILLKRR